MQLLATPWWVNLVVLLPIVSFIFWQRKELTLAWFALLCSMIFAIAFGLNEAIVVVYLRAAIGLTPNALNLYQQAQLLNALPHLFIVTEVLREVVTLVVLMSVSLLITQNGRERWAFFLWMFAFWDIFYYVGLYFIIQWPSSLLTQDILFLIPTPWIAQVWFPILVSILGILAVLSNKLRDKSF